jgi:hypothetical protein
MHKKIVCKHFSLLKISIILWGTLLNFNKIIFVPLSWFRAKTECLKIVATKVAIPDKGRRTYPISTPILISDVANLFIRSQIRLNNISLGDQENQASDKW